MIADPVVLADVRQSWSAVEKLSSDGLYSGLLGSGWVQFNRPDDAFNLPFVLAYACLDQVLSTLRDQGLFVSGSTLLGAKMNASRSALPWQDFDEVVAGKEHRNALAHEATLVSKADCLRYIAAIRLELNAWSIL